MSAYIILIFLVLLFWGMTKKGIVLCTKGNLDGNKMNLFAVLSFGSAFVVSALRNESVGADTINYIRYYKEVGKLRWSGLFNGGWNHHFFTTEKGFMIFEKICNDFMIPTQLFIALCAGIFVYGVYKLEKNYSKNSELLSVMSFFAVGAYLLSINALRQGIGVGLCCMAWVELKRGNWKKFIIEVLLACTFHLSCSVFFLVLVFERIPAEKKSLMISTIGIMFFGFFGAAVFPFILRWFPVYAARYGKGRWKINEANGIVAVWVAVVIIVILAAFLKDWSEKESHIDFEIMLFSLCYVAINIIGLSFDGAQRLSMLFQPFLIVFFDRSCSLWRGLTRNIYMAGIIVGMLIIFTRAASTAQYVYLPFWA